MIKGMSHLDYTSRVKSLNLPSLQYGRRFADMVQAFNKIIYNLEQIERENLFMYSSTSARGHSKKLLNLVPTLI